MSNNNKQKHTDMTNFLTNNREAVMQEIRNVNAHCTCCRLEAEKAEANGDTENAKFWGDKQWELCEDVQKLWGMLDAIDTYLETLED